MKLLSGLGSGLEALIDISIDYYQKHGVALIWRMKPTVIIHRSQSYFTSFRGCDYYGLQAGQYIEFEAKSTSKDDFLIRNISEQQYNRLKIVNDHQGWAFIIVHYINQQLYFRIPFPFIISCRQQHITKLSIALLQKKGYEIKISYPLHLDFLRISPVKLG